ncbi:MAG TPA: hypothetical protein ENN67_01725, partial [Firmicutes bacterium]|nr:hypothetical protein [Bacillota bacterium]
MARYVKITWLYICLPGVIGILAGCFSGQSPMAPSDDLFQTGAVSRDYAGTSLWGYWAVEIDPVTGIIDTVPVRNAMFTANVVNFLNGSPMNLGFKIIEVVNGIDFTDIDIDVTLKHPFPGMPQFNGYDVRGVFMGDGSKSMNYSTDLVYPVKGVDQFMFADPVGGNGAPDGYTRWFNISEFSKGGMPLLSYTPGMYASTGFNGTATLCPYKYFADGLGKT